MMPAGTYYVGDLCYVLHERWEQYCNTTILGNRCLDGEFNLPGGTRFATFGTKWGDGTYTDEQDREYGVDSGSIGCIRIEDIDLTADGNFTDGGQVITFERDFSTWSADGEIRFGNILINTDHVEEEAY